MECFFAIPPLPVLQPHCDKIAITHMVVFCNCFFFAIAAHQGSRMFAITCIFHQVATTSRKDQTSHIKLFYQFFAIAKSHCYKGGAITLRHDLQSTTFCYATVFSFAIAAHQSLQTHCKGCCNHQYFWTRLQPIKQRPP
jgi:hypothetical protein